MQGLSAVKFRAQSELGPGRATLPRCQRAVVEFRTSRQHKQSARISSRTALTFTIEHKNVLENLKLCDDIPIHGLQF